MAKLNFYLLLLASIFILACQEDPNASVNAKDSESVDNSDTDNPVNNNKDPYVGNGEDAPYVPPVPVCTQTCDVAKDCVKPFEARELYQAENYSCDQGICVHLGCTSDDNCKEAHPAFDYKCSPKGECVDKCDTPADCVLWDEYPGIDDAMDENNFACSDGACLPLGCLSSAECVVSNGTTYVCSPISGSGINTCHQKCDYENDDVSVCVTSLDNLSRDEDNYICDEGNRCQYEGCSGDDECEDGFVCLGQN